MRRLRRNYRKDHECCIKITIASVNGGGATHMSLLTGNYYAKVLKKRTAIVDISDNHDYDSLFTALGKGSSDVRIDSGRLSIYQRIVKADIEGIFELGYGCVIFDAGDRYARMKNEAAMCDKRLMILNASSWKVQETMKRYRDNVAKHKREQWKYFFSFGDKRSVVYMEEELGIRMHRIPFIPDPFHIEKKQFEAVERIVLED